MSDIFCFLLNYILSNPGAVLGSSLVCSILIGLLCLLASIGLSQWGTPRGENSGREEGEVRVFTFLLLSLEAPLEPSVCLN